MNQNKKYFLLYLLILCSIYTSSYAFSPVTEISGKVYSGNKGLPGISVTDGYTIVQTDAGGKYRLSANPAAEFVYLSLPSGYKVPLQDHCPYFFRHISSKEKSRQHFDFSLEKDNRSADRYVLVVCADPQIYFDEELPMLKEAVEDMTQLVSGTYAGMPAYGVVCGDIIGDIHHKPAYFKPVKQIFNASGIPFFYVAGNHDLDTEARSNELSKVTYKTHFGPTYYSFDRGKIHYIVLDAVFYLGKNYVGYIPETQLKWLQQDLKSVPEGATVMVITHIPSYSGEARNGHPEKEIPSQVIINREHLYNILKPFQAHILSGHEHYQENYMVSERLFDHVHAAISGLFWQAPLCWDGTPTGYTVYEIDGSQVNWYFKTVNQNRNYQFRVYPTGHNPMKPEAVTLNVWNYDPAWKIVWYENGIHRGSMKPYKGYDPAIDAYVTANREHFKYKYIGPVLTAHLFYAIPESTTSVLKIEVTDRSGRTYSWTSED